MNCPHCSTDDIYPTNHITQLGYHIYRCRRCKLRFNERTGTAFNYLQFPTDVVMLVVLWRLRYKLSLRDLTEMFLLRGLCFTHETVRDWETRFAPLLSDHLKSRRHGQTAKSWYVDETYLKVEGRWQYLYRAIDRDGNLVDIRLSETRDLEAAKSFFAQAVQTVGHEPDRVTTDKHTAYPHAIQATMEFCVIHRTNQYLNNHIEQDHRSLKQRDYSMRGFSSASGAARFCTAHEEVRQYFRCPLALSLSLRRQHFRQRCKQVVAALAAA